MINSLLFKEDQHNHHQHDIVFRTLPTRLASRTVRDRFRVKDERGRPDEVPQHVAGLRPLLDVCLPVDLLHNTVSAAGRPFYDGITMIIPAPDLCPRGIHPRDDQPTTPQTISRESESRRSRYEYGGVGRGKSDDVRTFRAARKRLFVFSYHLPRHGSWTHTMRSVQRCAGFADQAIDRREPVHAGSGHEMFQLFAQWTAGCDTSTSSLQHGIVDGGVKIIRRSGVQQIRQPLPYMVRV